jgi:hypothetical protein
LTKHLLRTQQLDQATCYSGIVGVSDLICLRRNTLLSIYSNTFADATVKLGDGDLHVADDAFQLRRIGWIQLDGAVFNDDLTSLSSGFDAPMSHLISKCLIKNADRFA